MRRVLVVLIAVAAGYGGHMYLEGILKGREQIVREMRLDYDRKRRRG